MGSLAFPRRTPPASAAGPFRPSSSGRPRRCGWFDAVVVRTAARLNGLTSLALTKIDVLSGLPTIRICTGYEHHGQYYDEVPASAQVLEGVTPIYEDLPG